MKSGAVFHYMMVITAVFTPVITVLCSPADADPAATPRMVTLRQALEIATSKNPQVHQQQFAVSASAGDSVTAGLRPNPQLQLNGDALDFENNQFVNGQTKQYGASLTIPLELGGKRARRIASAHFTVDSNLIALHETRRQVALQAAGAWLDALSARLALDLATKAKIIADSTVHVNEFRLERQDISVTEMMRTKISAQQYDLQLADAERQVASSERALATLLNITDSIEVNENDDWAWTPPPFDSALAFAESQRSDARLSRTAIAAADAGIALQKANAVPDLSIAGDYMMSQGVPLYGVSLDFELPLFSRNQGELRKAFVQKDLAVFSDSALHIQLRNELAAAFGEYETKKASLDKSKAIIAMSEQVLNTVEYSYRSGNTTILDLFDARNTWYGARQSYNEALIDFKRAEVRLCIAIGDIRPMTNNPQ
jgi:cobalt-zinc-cadmium efflux system outer membrane protein